MLLTICKRLQIKLSTSMYLRWSCDIPTYILSCKGFVLSLTLSGNVPLKHPMPVRMSLNLLCISVVILALPFLSFCIPQPTVIYSFSDLPLLLVWWRSLSLLWSFGLYLPCFVCSLICYSLYWSSTVSQFTFSNYSYCWGTTQFFTSWICLVY